MLGLSRPELSVLLAYSKLDIYEDLIQSNLPDDTHFISDLTRYFPEKMQDKYQQEIAEHPLRREIIATSVANSVVNRMGITFFRRTKDDTGMKGCDIARAYTVSRDAFNIRALWDAIEEHEQKVPAKVQLIMYLDIRRPP